ncbi:activating transcription factor 7-interacting 1 isoform X2 [Pelobates cultripes]|uniref:Activating transcription factor 7-interacting 1 isoform X2 n=2 Tax=Pelobates cultripes TaxID=61616 RepID=A0AAD1WGL9_PELCU|nr:activating transcription factor 7-interacting 1 isoform X2 [Pelobates cultripes]
MAICLARFKMDSSEEPQKKIFKARKTMKFSGRQQLEAVHKAKEELLKPAEVKLLNGKHENGDSDINSSHHDLDYMAEKKDINGTTDVISDAHEVPIVKLSDIKEGLRNSDHTKDLKLTLDIQTSDTLASKETEISVSVGDIKTHTCQDKAKDEEDYAGNNSLVIDEDQNDSEELPVEDSVVPCDADISEEQLKLNLSGEEDNHILSEGIQEVEDERLRENTCLNEEQENLDILPDQQYKEDNEMLEENLKSTLETCGKDSKEVNGEEEILKESLQNELENLEVLEERDKIEVLDEEGSEKQVNALVDGSEEAEETLGMVVAEKGGSSEQNHIPDTLSVDQDASEEAISSSMEVDQNAKGEENKSSSATEAAFEKPLKLQSSGLDSLEPMETEEIVPILEKLAPVEDLISESDVNIDEDKADLSPSKQENSEPGPSEGFLRLSDEEEPCDIQTTEENGSSSQALRTEDQEAVAEKQQQKEKTNEQEQQVEQTVVSQRKRSKSEDLDGESSKKRRFDSEEYEAELQVKITGGNDLNKKLHMVIQKMLDEKLNVLQCAVFDTTLADLKTRVEKIECKKHEDVLYAIQAKIARLTKRFGAAKEDLKKRPEQTTANQPASPEKTANEVTPSGNAVSYRNSSTVRQMLESKRNVGETTPTASVQSSTTGAPLLPSPSSLPLRNTNTTQISATQSTPNTSLQGRAPPDWKLIQQKINASSIGSSQNTVTTQPKPSTPVTSAPVMSSVLSAPSTTTVVGNTQVSASTTQPMSVSLQSLPVILHVPVAMPSQSQILQGTTGTLVTNQQSGNVEFIPVQNQSAVSNLTKTPSVTMAATKPINSSSLPSPGIQRNSPASSVASTLAVQAITPSHSVAQISRPSLQPVGSTGVYNQANNRTPSQLKSPLSGFSSSSTPELPTASRQEQANRTPVSETPASKRAAETTTPSGKAGSGIIDLTLDEEDHEAASQESKRTSSGVPSSQVTGRPSQPTQSSQPNSLQTQSVPAGPSQTTIHVLPSAQTTVNITQRPGTQAPTRATAPRPPNNQQMVYTTTNLPTVPASTPARSTLMQNQNLKQISPQTGGVPVRMPQATAYVVNNGMAMGTAGPQLTVHHRPAQEPARPIHPAPLPEAPQPQRLPAEAGSTSAPQKPHLKLARVQSQNGIVLSWSVLEVDRSCAVVDSYHLYAYHEDPTATSPSQWKKIGEVKALPLPMACTLTQFVSGSKYYFAVRAKDIYGRFGPFCDPQSTDVISTQSS